MANTRDDDGGEGSGSPRHPGVSSIPPDPNVTPGDAVAVPQPAAARPSRLDTTALSPLLEVHGAIENGLRQRISSDNAAQRTPEASVAEENIQGAGIGSAPASDHVLAPPGCDVLSVFVAEPISESELRALLVARFGVREEALASVPIAVVVTGPIVAGMLAHDVQPAPTAAFNYRSRIRPAPGGVSVGLAGLNGAGTLGCLAYGRSAPRDGYTLMLSCNHVIANTNNVAANACLPQPGIEDGGRCPADQIAAFERYVTINFSGNNVVDCATGWCWPDRVRREIVYASATGPAFMRMSNTPVSPVCNQAVGKSGRSTGMTNGYVRCDFTSCRAWYPGKRSALFVNQIAVEGGSGPFSAKGDSGAIVWTWDTTMSPIGLLFAGATTSRGRHLTFANPMAAVLQSLDIYLYT